MTTSIYYMPNTSIHEFSLSAGITRATVLVFHARGKGRNDDQGKLDRMGIDISKLVTHVVDTQDFAKDLEDWTQNNGLKDFVRAFTDGVFALPHEHNAGNDAMQTVCVAMHMLSEALGADVKNVLTKLDTKFVGLDFRGQRSESDDRGRSIRHRSRDVGALPEGHDWKSAMRTYHMVVDERFEENNRFTLRKYYSPSKIDWSNLPRYNFVSGPSGEVKVSVRRRISYQDHKTGRHVTRNKNFHMSPDTEFVPLAKTKDWILERGGLELLPDQPEEHKEQANVNTEVSLQEDLQALSLEDSVVNVDKAGEALVSNGHDAGA